MRIITRSKAIFFLLIAAFIPTLLSAQEEEKTDTLKGWHYLGSGALSLSQASLNNWAAGGQNSIAGLSILNLSGNYKGENKSWQNSLELAYGSQKLSKEELVKTDDRINLSSKYGQRAKGAWFYSSLFTFRSQFFPGYRLSNNEQKISDFLSPGYLVFALGMDYKPSDDFTVMIAPLSNKTTVVLDQELANSGAFGVMRAERNTFVQIVKEGKNIRYQFGGFIKMSYKRKLMENVSLLTRADFFSDYLNSPENIDVYWDVILNLKVNKFFSANVSTTLIYDDDISIFREVDGVEEELGPRVQFKEILSVGLSYNF